MDEPSESPEWEYYRCKIGGSGAFVYFDPGFTQREQHAWLSQLLRLRVRLCSPDQDGIASSTDLTALAFVEEALAQFSEESRAAYVGRITVDGYVHFFCYVDAAEQDLRELSENVLQHGYRLEYVLEKDPQKTGYFEELCPEPSPKAR